MNCVTRSVNILLFAQCLGLPANDLCCRAAFLPDELCLVFTENVHSCSAVTTPRKRFEVCFVIKVLRKLN